MPDVQPLTCQVGPDHEVVSLDHLPPPDTRRWVARRKATVVGAVHAGLITVEDACHRYRLSLEEFSSWQRALVQHGIGGLKATRRRIGRFGRHV